MPGTQCLLNKYFLMEWTNLFTPGEIACLPRRPCHTRTTQQMAANERQRHLGAYTLNSRFLPIKSKITQETKSSSASSCVREKELVCGRRAAELLRPLSNAVGCLPTMQGQKNENSCEGEPRSESSLGGKRGEAGHGSPPEDGEVTSDHYDRGKEATLRTNTSPGGGCFPSSSEHARRCSARPQLRVLPEPVHAGYRVAAVPNPSHQGQGNLP